MKTMYAVIGHTGEYYDHTQWLVCVYPEEEQAQQHAELANVAVKELRREIDAIEVDGDLPWDEEQEARQKLLREFPYDANVAVYYTGSRYEARPVPAVAHVDEYQDLPRISF